MKKVIKFKLFFFIFFISSYARVFSSDITESQITNLEQQNLLNFQKHFKFLCSSQKFFFNLEKHSSFPAFGGTDDWKEKCKIGKNLKSSEEFANFIIRNFKFKKISKSEGILTGYYQPLINVSKKKDEVFKFPILKKNISYSTRTRKFINENFKLDDVLLWTDNKIDLFFLHIQGSGLGMFKNKKIINLSYSGNNGLSYSSIGKYLVEKKYLESSKVDLFVIKNWLKSNPELSDKIMNINERFIFFKIEKKSFQTYPQGAIGLELMPNQSVAVDRKYYPLGLPMIILGSRDEFIKPVISMDTGSAIKGPNRADLFFGRGKKAESMAGILKKKIYIYAFIPYIR